MFFVNLKGFDFMLDLDYLVQFVNFLLNLKYKVDNYEYRKCKVI